MVFKADCSFHNAKSLVAAGVAAAAAVVVAVAPPGGLPVPAIPLV